MKNRYTKKMGIESKKTAVKIGNEVKEILQVSFSNGALEQLEALKKFLGTDDPVEVIKAGISVVQKIKEDEEHKPVIKKENV